MGPNSATIWTAPTREGKLGALFPGNSLQQGLRRTPEHQEAGLRQGRAQKPCHRGAAQPEEEQLQEAWGKSLIFRVLSPLQNSAKIYRKKRDDLCGSILTGRGPRGTFWNAGNLLDLELGDGYMSGR